MNEFAPSGALRETMELLWKEFAVPSAEGGTLSKKEMSKLWLESKYPSEFKSRPAFRASERNEVTLRRSTSTKSTTSDLSVMP